MYTVNPDDFSDIELLLKVLDVIREHGSIEVSGWFCSGVDEFMSANGSLDECLKLKQGQGSRHIASQYHAWKRNGYLIEAWGLCFAKGDWGKSGVLSKQVKEFKEQWFELSNLTEPDPAWSKMRTALFYAFKSGSRYLNGLPPESQRQLHDIVRPVPDVSAVDYFLYKLKP